MAENKSNLVQLKISDKTKEEIQSLADKTGLNLTTYIYHILAEKIEKNTNRD